MTKNTISTYTYDAINDNFNIPEKQNERVTKKIATEIKNAWTNSGYVDQYGAVWVRFDRAHSILRTSKPVARSIYAGFLDFNKFEVPDGNGGILQYVRIDEISAYLARLINSPIDPAKNLIFSDMHCLAVRHCDLAFSISAIFNSQMSEKIKDMKEIRIKKFNISYDELTGVILDKKSAEFSHTRSRAMYPMLSTYIENGLVVNRETHQIINDHNVNNEADLYQLCQSNGWDTTWLTPFQNFLISQGFTL